MPNTKPRPPKRHRTTTTTTTTTPPLLSSSDPEYVRRLDPETASALRADDAEIASLEAKLGLRKSSGRDKLKREYAKLEGFGDDFVDYLDDLDGLVDRVVTGADGSEEEEDNDLEDLEEEVSDEEVPMKTGSPFRDESDVSEDDDDDVAEEEHAESDSENDQEDFKEENESTGSDSDNDSDDESTTSLEPERDHSPADIYHPTSGQDIYGNQLEHVKPTTTTKYIPPHLRHTQTNTNSDEDEEEQHLARTINGILNRLSDDTLESISQQIISLYSHRSAHRLNARLYTTLHKSTIHETVINDKFAPLYAALIAAIHFHIPDFGGYVLERLVPSFISSLRSSEHQTNESSNYALLLCHFYNYEMIHCRLLYDIIHHLISTFREIDVRVLLLLLRHSGFRLRSDDPTSLKEIVMEVQERARTTVANDDENKEDNTKLQFMLDAIKALKNNQKKKTLFGSHNDRYRKFVNRIKASSTKSQCWNIPLEDLLHAEEKGRWWRVGASWTGRHFHSQPPPPVEEQPLPQNKPVKEETEELLRLASKHRMNTDDRKSIFCIIMSGTDIDDTFETLVRGQFFTKKRDRDIVRVLMHCCGEERCYNPYYAHLAVRICEFEGNCKFTFKLAYWDAFQTLDDAKERKAGNLAKLCLHLIQHDVLHLNVLKGMEELMEMEDGISDVKALFLTVLFSKMMEDSQRETIEKWFGDKSGIPKTAEGDTLRDGLSLVLRRYVEHHPKCKKGSRFRKHWKLALKLCDSDSIDAL